MNLGIGLSVTTTYQSIPAVGLEPDAAIAALFQTGTPGVYHEGAWYDPSDSSTVWQDAAGTTPAGVGDPVGRIDDKSGNGNHATQSTLTARPTLSARVNLITYSEQLNSNDWSKYAVAISADAGVAPDSTTTADLLYATSTGAVRSLYRGGLPSVSKRHRYYAKASGKDWFCILAETTAAGGVWFDVANGVLGTVSAGWTGSIESAGNGWYVCTATSTASFSTYTAVGPTDADNSTTVTASGTDGILVWGADVRTASTSSALPAYQQITDAATYDTVGFPYYLDFDGVDDWMVSSSFSAINIPITAACGFNAPLNDFVFDGHANNEFGFLMQSNAGVESARLIVNNNFPYLYAPCAAGLDHVARFLGNGASSAISIDGVETTGSTNASADVTVWTLGKAGGSAIYLDGRIYGFVAVDRTLTAGEIDDVEAYLAAKSGVTL